MSPADRAVGEHVQERGAVGSCSALDLFAAIAAVFWFEKHLGSDSIETFRINGETKARLQVLAAQSDMNLTEFVRLVLECRAWGAEHVASLAADRIRQAVGSVG